MNILATLDSETYNDRVFKIVQETANSTDKGLYISLNKTYKSLMGEFQEHGIDSRKFRFIDTITATLIEPKQTDNCLFLKNADDVKELYKGIIKTVKTHDIDMVIFDSLSSLTTYQDTKQIIHFLNMLLGSLTILNTSSLLTCLRSDNDNTLIQQVRMKVDKETYY